MKLYNVSEISTLYDLETTVEISVSKQKSLTSKETLFVFIDTEYCEEFFLTLQIYVKNYTTKIIVVNKRLYQIYPEKKDILDSLSQEYLSSGFCDKVYFMDLDNDYASCLDEALSLFLTEKGALFHKKVKVFLYWSVKDLYPSFGFLNVLTCMLRRPQGNYRVNRIYKLRSLRGSIAINDTHYEIVDLYGLSTSKGGLKAMAASFGVEMGDKGALDNYKENMNEALLHENLEVRLTFLRYSIRDSSALSDIYDAILKYINNILLDCFAFPINYLFTEFSLPATIGRMVSTCFENFIYNTASKEVSIHNFKLCLYKIGYLKDSQKDHKRDLLERNEMLKTKDPLLIEAHCTRNKYLFMGFSLCSIPFLHSLDRKTSALTSAMLSGGRTLACRYKEIYYRNVLDVDIASCYASCMNLLSYPIGAPTMYIPTNNEIRLTLGKFLNKYSLELIPNLYQIVIDGKLSFDQDLIYSKILTEKQNKLLYEFNENVDTPINEIHGEHVLLRREIKNGVLTSRLIEVMKGVCNKKEWAEVLDMSVNSAIFYRKSDEISSIKEWVNVISDPKTPSTATKWFGIKISSFSEPISIRRAKEKALSKKLFSSKSKEDIEKYGVSQGIQILLKTLNNSLYGVIGSKFFDINNIVIANQITAFARAELYLISKPLNLINCITDGGLYEVNDVFFLKSTKSSTHLYKPSMNKMSDSYALKSHPLIEIGPLSSDNWSELIKENSINYNQLDSLARAHINSFWSPYNLELVFKLEHKPEHTGSIASTYAKAHYCIKTDTGFVTKIRGHREEKENIANYPLFQIFRNSINGIFDIPKDLNYKKKDNLSIKDYLSEHSKDSFYKKRPGDFFYTDDRVLKFNHNHFPFYTYTSYLSYKKKINKKEYISFHLNKKHESSNLKEMLVYMEKASDELPKY